MIKVLAVALTFFVLIYVIQVLENRTIWEVILWQHKQRVMFVTREAIPADCIGIIKSRV